jgi:hypothetical protein
LLKRAFGSMLRFIDVGSSLSTELKDGSMPMALFRWLRKV